MGWSVHGTDFRFSFRVDANGLSVSGEGRQSYSSSLNIFLDTSEIDPLTARWSIYRASEVAKMAVRFGCDLQDMKYYLDAATVKATSKPIGIIKHYDVMGAGPAFLMECMDKNFAVLKRFKPRDLD